MKDRLLKEVVRISDELIENPFNHPSGLTYIPQIYKVDNKEFSNAIEDIYNGLSGEILFLFESYKIIRNKRYLESAEVTSQWLVKYCMSQSSSNYSLITGRLGVAYVLVELFRLTGKYNYINQAVEISLGCEGFIFNPKTDSTFNNGLAGLIIGLLHVHSHSSSQEVFKLIESAVITLIDKSFFSGENGLYWGRSNRGIKGFTGFANGVSGIAFSLIELAKYTNNKFFGDLASEALKYEDFFFTEEINNWLDLRTNFWAKKEYNLLLKKFEKGDYIDFLKGKDTTTWCYGAPGIGLTRIKAFEYFKTSNFQEQMKNALLKTQESVSASLNNNAHNLCHGLEGNAMLFIEAYKSTRNQIFLQKAKNAAERSLDWLERINKNENEYLATYSLFTGKAGIGYFYTKILRPNSGINILCPSLPKQLINKFSLNKNPSIQTEFKDLLHLRICKDYSRTFKIVEYYLGQNEAKHFIEFLKLKRTDQHNVCGFENFTFLNKKLVEEVFDLENSKVFLDSSIKSFSLQFFEKENKLRNAKKIIVLPQTDFVKVNLKVNNNIQIKKASRDWGSDLIFENLNEFINQNDCDFYFLLIAEIERIKEIKIERLTYLIIKTFQNELNIKEAVKHLLSNFDLNETNDQEIEIVLISLIKELIIGGILYIWEEKYFTDIPCIQQAYA